MGKPKRVTAHMRAALRILERDPQAHQGIHHNTLNNLVALDLALPRRHTCGECHQTVFEGWFLTQKGRAAVRNLGVVNGGAQGADG